MSEEKREPILMKNKRMILLHGFIKKDQKTPKMDLDLALKRFSNLKGSD
jgi:phage-related protein